MIPEMNKVGAFAALYDWEERTRRALPSLYWLRLASIYSSRWPRC